MPRQHLLGGVRDESHGGERHYVSQLQLGLVRQGLVSGLSQGRMSARSPRADTDALRWRLHSRAAIPTTPTSPSALPTRPSPLPGASTSSASTTRVSTQALRGTGMGRRLRDADLRHVHRGYTAIRCCESWLSPCTKSHLLALRGFRRRGKVRDQRSIS